MKKTAFILFLFLLCTGGVVSAQLFVGGGLYVETEGGSFDDGTEVTDKDSEIWFGVRPVVGFFFSDRFAAGGYVGFSLYREKMPGDPEVIYTANNVSFTPFVRYYIVRGEKFAVFGTGYAGFGMGTSKTKTSGTTTDGPLDMSIYVGIYPSISYDITEHITLETDINLLDLGFSVDIEKDRAADPETTDITTETYFDFSTDGILYVGSISISAIYKF